MISWVILAGGQASRMGGKDKGLLIYKTRPLIEHSLKPFTQQQFPVFINANRNFGFYSDYAPVIRDLIPGFYGPLAGIHAGLSQLETEWVGFIPCDSPYISEDFVSRMSAEIHKPADILVAYDGNIVQPVFSLWNRRILPQLESFLQNGDRKMKLFLLQCDTRYIDFSDSPSLFINLNTPDELSNNEADQL
ncbi:molybdenum cofactor guanylyltransferase MobA [Vibrio sp. HA2012]|uniref:molybdenum cofactor guanylyltransferase MobA n=1 Tax=Vibrio sp. HA2012 TaxID=1971595 RepID=UPI000C2B8A31|nr:molybdenum cofactor guanylyltransferase MobA [Vibrio sp. HA2012]PJC87928.1 molybdenum cofactor guanylyltransferase MobA [Vibrio sp. HA2012]